MNYLQQKIKEYFEDELFVRNRKAAYLRDKTIIRIVLMASLVCMALLFCVSFFVPPYFGMRWMYLIMFAVYALMVALSFALPDKAVYFLIYFVHFSFVGFCAYSSAFVFPDSISVMVLSEMFIFPTLFLDKELRVNAASLLTGALYLLVISPYKVPGYFADEVVNVLCFTLLGCIVGSVTRRAQLTHFDSMEQLRIRQEQYQLAMEHNKGIICEFNVRECCVTMSPKVAALFDVPQKVYDVPYGPVKKCSISPVSSGAYIQFYESILHGEKSGTAEFQCLTVKGWRWQKAFFTTIFSDTEEPISAVISFNDITEEKAQAEAQRLKAEKDGLTGIYNRATTETLINTAIAEGAGAGGMFLLADLDNLKIINDSLGHPQGDKALQAIARALRTQFGHGAVIGRVGGDEFAAFVKEIASQELLAEAMGQLQQKISAETVGDAGDYTLSASIGVVLCTSADTSFDDLYKKADKALYQAKKNGKNQFAVYV